MEPGKNLQIAAFDQKTARYVVLGGGGLSFSDPRTAQEAGYLVFRGPVVTAGEVETQEPMVAPVVLFTSRQLVISQVAGTEHRAPTPARPAPIA
jgi:hypothetical protein